MIIHQVDTAVCFVQEEDAEPTFVCEIPSGESFMSLFLFGCLLRYDWITVKCAICLSLKFFLNPWNALWVVDNSKLELQAGISFHHQSETVRAFFRTMVLQWQTLESHVDIFITNEFVFYRLNSKWKRGNCGRRLFCKNTIDRSVLGCILNPLSSKWKIKGVVPACNFHVIYMYQIFILSDINLLVSLVVGEFLPWKIIRTLGLSFTDNYGYQDLC